MAEKFTCVIEPGQPPSCARNPHAPFLPAQFRYFPSSEQAGGFNAAMDYAPVKVSHESCLDRAPTSSDVLPEVQAEATIINFMVTEAGLEDQLLALVVRKERPDLEEQMAQLVSDQNGFMIKTKELEDDLLQRLANAEGDITEDIELIENLEESKRIATDIAEKQVRISFMIGCLGESMARGSG